jgi:cell shape-determining protein MreC
VEKMRKEKDIQRLKEIAKLLKEALSSLYDIEDQNEIFNSKQAFEVIETYTTFNASLDDLLYDLIDYFEELAFIHEKE